MVVLNVHTQISIDDERWSHLDILTLETEPIAFC